MLLSQSRFVWSGQVLDDGVNPEAIRPTEEEYRHGGPDAFLQWGDKTAVV
jgi:hypothetical protein